MSRNVEVDDDNLDEDEGVEEAKADCIDRNISRRLAVRAATVDRDGYSADGELVANKPNSVQRVRR
jgi:hypothetical protein